MHVHFINCWTIILIAPFFFHKFFFKFRQPSLRTRPKNVVFPGHFPTSKPYLTRLLFGYQLRETNYRKFISSILVLVLLKQSLIYLTSSRLSLQWTWPGGDWLASFVIFLFIYTRICLFYVLVLNLCMIYFLTLHSDMTFHVADMEINKWMSKEMVVICVNI